MGLADLLGSEATGHSVAAVFFWRVNDTSGTMTNTLGGSIIESIIGRSLTGEEQSGLLDIVADIDENELDCVGGLHVVSGAAGQALTASVWEKVDQFTANGASANTTPDHVNDIVTVPARGIYRVSYGASLTVTGGSVDVAARARWNGVAQNQTLAQSFVHAVQAGQVLHIGATGFVDVTAKDTDFDLQIQCSGSQTVTLVHAHLAVERVTRSMYPTTGLEYAQELVEEGHITIAQAKAMLGI